MIASAVQTLSPKQEEALFPSWEAPDDLGKALFLGLSDPRLPEKEEEEDENRRALADRANDSSRYIACSLSFFLAHEGR